MLPPTSNIGKSSCCDNVGKSVQLQVHKLHTLIKNNLFIIVPTFLLVAIYHLQSVHRSSADFSILLQ